jgi:putative transposase
MKSNQKTALVMDALFMAVKRRKPKGKVLIHSDQGCQFTSYEWENFCEFHKLDPSMSRKGNCWDNAVVESFFSSLKKERIKKKIYRGSGGSTERHIQLHRVILQIQKAA